MVAARTPLLRPWHIPVLRIVVATPGVTAVDIGARVYPTWPRDRRPRLANHELLELKARGLVTDDGRTPRHWSPALFAAEALRIAERRRHSPR